MVTVPICVRFEAGVMLEMANILHLNTQLTEQLNFKPIMLQNHECRIANFN